MVRIIMVRPLPKQCFTHHVKIPKIGSICGYLQKDEEFFPRDIRTLPERWKRVVASGERPS